MGTRALLTISTEERQPAFADRDFGIECVMLLRTQSTRDSIAVLAYCFMPDHAHLLLRVDGSTGIVDFLRAFKSLTTRIWWSHGNTGRLWQRSFHDHVLRQEERECDYVDYILENPLKAGLIDEHGEYALVGSFEYDVSED